MITLFIDWEFSCFSGREVRLGSSASLFHFSTKPVPQPLQNPGLEVIYIAESTGTTTSVSSVEVVKPPIIAIPIGLRAPGPIPKASGTVPATVAREVIRIGRRRDIPASISACRLGFFQVD